MPIGSVCKTVTSGGTPSRKVPTYYLHPNAVGGTPWLKTKELEDRVIFSTEEYITDDAIRSSSAKLLPRGTVAMAMYGATVGKLGLLGAPMTCNQAVCAMVVDEDIADNRFLFYNLLFNRERIINLATGSAQQNLSGQVIKDLQLHFPKVDEQRQVADVLWNMDQLIEVNNRVISDLGAFVQAHFQATLNAFEDSSFCSLASTAEVISGGTPSTSEPLFWGGDLPWFSVVDTPAETEIWVIETEKSITNEGLKSSAAKLIQPGATILTARGTVGKTALVGMPLTINQSCYALKCRFSEYGYFNFFRVRSAIDSLQRMSHGSVFSTITRDTLDSVQVLDIPAAAIRRFDSETHPLMSQMLGLIEENRSLTKVRNELLPLLMTGRVRVIEGEAA